MFGSNARGTARNFVPTPLCARLRAQKSLVHLAGIGLAGILACAAAPLATSQSTATGRSANAAKTPAMAGDQPRAASAPALTPTTMNVYEINGSDPYTMGCAVSSSAIPGVTGPTGSLTFADTTVGETLRTAPLGTPTQAATFENSQRFYPIGNASNASAPTGGGMVTADLNGDTVPDLVWTAGGSVEGLLGNGDGTFTAQAPVNLLPLLASLTGTSESQLQVSAASLAAADFNGDGKPDVVGQITVLSGQSTFSSYFFVLIGNGDGTFQTPTTANFYAGEASSMATGDFNGDGFIDFAATTWAGADLTIEVFLGNASGTLSAPLSFTEENLNGPIIAGHFTAGPLDLAVTTTNGQMLVLVGNGDGTFQAPITTAFAPAGGVNSVVAADFNQDGKLDLGLAAGSEIYVLLGNGDGTFQVPSAPVIQADAPQHYDSTPLVAGDFNGDGIPDLAIVGGYNAVVVLGNGNGTFQSATPINVPVGGEAAAAADFNGDGHADLAVGGENTDEGDFDVSTGLLNVELEFTSATAEASASNLTIAAGTISTHTLTCTYGGDSNYAGSSAGVSKTYTPAATPIFSLLVGNYATAQTVTITDVSGGPIYYTNDLSTPTTGSTLYTGPITVSTTETLKAIAFPLVNTPSAVSEAVYTITDPPAFSVPGGTYSTQQSVSLSDGTAGAVIYYTTDGSTPGKTSAQYTSTPIPITGNVTLHAVALAPGNLFSPVVTASYSFPLASTTTAIQSSLTNADENQRITLTATVTGNNPAGTVVFTTGSQNLGSAPLMSGVATLQTSFATAGNYPITAAYSGDASNLASTSTSVTVVVAAPSFAVSSTPASQTISPGQSASFTFTVTPAAGYTGTVNFACGTLPSEATCSFNQSSVVISGSTAGTSTLTISTQAPTTSRNTPPALPFGPWSAGGTMALAGIGGLAFAPGKMRRWNRTFRALLGLLLLGALWLPLVGCGGGGGGTTMVGGTPAGSYTVSVTASDSAGGSSTSAQITLIVQ